MQEGTITNYYTNLKSVSLVKISLVVFSIITSFLFINPQVSHAGYVPPGGCSTQGAQCCISDSLNNYCEGGLVCTNGTCQTTQAPGLPPPNNPSGGGVNIGETFKSPFGMTNTLGDLVSLIIRLAFVGAGLLILFMFMIAGWNTLMGAGQNNPEQAAKGKKAAGAAALGFVVVFVAYWIVRLIEAIAGVQFITSFSP